MATKTLPIMTDATGQKIASVLESVTPAVGRRNLGELVFSGVPLSDACLKLANGQAVPRGAYADFYDYIASLAIAQDPGVITGTSAGTGENIGKYVYDSTNQRVFLPNLTNLFIEGTADSSSAGSYVAPGAPEIEGQIKDFAYTSLSGKSASSYTGAFTRSDGSQGQTCSWSSGTLTLQVINFNASNSNSIYGSSNTIQPPAVKQYVYIVVANAYRLPATIDIDEVMTDINDLQSKVSFLENNSLRLISKTYIYPSGTYTISIPERALYLVYITTMYSGSSYLGLFRATAYNSSTDTDGEWVKIAGDLSAAGVSSMSVTWTSGTNYVNYPATLTANVTGGNGPTLYLYQFAGSSPS